MRETWDRFLGWEDALKKGTATHSSILIWRIPWREGAGGLQSMGSQRARHNWVAHFSLNSMWFFRGPPVGHVQLFTAIHMGSPPSSLSFLLPHFTSSSGIPFQINYLNFSPCLRVSSHRNPNEMSAKGGEVGIHTHTHTHTHTPSPLCPVIYIPQHVCHLSQQIFLFLFYTGSCH